MKKIFFATVIALATLVSCDEWEPVYTLKYSDPESFTPVTMTSNTTIAALKDMYVNAPVKIDDDIIIKGQVISSDVSGNVYRSIYIQDETGAIEVKIGKTSLYNDYKLGQWIYVKCSGLTLGAYNGMVQLGYKDPTGAYQTAYIDVQYIIDTHIFRGALDTPVSPVSLSASEILAKANFGKYVTLKGLTYGNEIFALIYVNPSLDTKLQSNRVFLSDKSWGVTTWAMSKDGFIKYLNSGKFDTAKTADSKSTVAQIKETLIKNASAVTVSQYFKMGTTDLQVRTSGYCKFADSEIDSEILSGGKVDLTGILTSYNGEAQFTLLNLDGAVKEK
jgi:DNA/RNA endonuclease YhcR with UshA esterase domain